MAFDEPVIQSRAGELDGYTVVYEPYSADVDPAPFLEGLADDRCQCPHWGIVVSGRIVGIEDVVSLRKAGTRHDCTGDWDEVRVRDHAQRV